MTAGGSISCRGMRKALVATDRMKLSTSHGGRKHISLEVRSATMPEDKKLEYQVANRRLEER